MSKFLDCWLTEASRVLGGDLGTPVEFTASTERRPTEAALQVASEVTGDWTGKFTLTISESALAALLIQAGDIAAEQGIDRETWRKLFGQVAQAAAQLLAKSEGCASEVVSTVLASGETEAGSFFQVQCGQVSTTVVLMDGVAVKTAAPEVAAPAAATVSSPVGSAPASPVASPASAVKAAPPPTASAPPPASRTTRSAPTAAEPAADTGPRKGIELLLDIELEASLRFGSREMPLNEILELGPGDVIQLNRHVSDPVDLIVGDKIVARGDVVLVNGNFGLRVTEVAEPRKCLESIRCLF